MRCGVRQAGWPGSWLGCSAASLAASWLWLAGQPEAREPSPREPFPYLIFYFGECALRARNAHIGRPPAIRDPSVRAIANTNTIIPYPRPIGSASANASICPFCPTKSHKILFIVIWTYMTHHHDMTHDKVA